MKFDGMLSYDLKSAVKEVLGTCVSVGVTVEGKSPREMIRAINNGEHDSVLVA
jgi:large subunit ribosomal protein L11